MNRQYHQARNRNQRASPPGSWGRNRGGSASDPRLSSSFSQRGTNLNHSLGSISSSDLNSNQYPMQNTNLAGRPHGEHNCFDPHAQYQYRPPVPFDPHAQYQYRPPIPYDPHAQYQYRPPIPSDFSEDELRFYMTPEQLKACDAHMKKQATDKKCTDRGNEKKKKSTMINRLMDHVSGDRDQTTTFANQSTTFANQSHSNTTRLMGMAEEHVLMSDDNNGSKKRRQTSSGNHSKKRRLTSSDNREDSDVDAMRIPRRQQEQIVNTNTSTATSKTQITAGAGEVILDSGNKDELSGEGRDAHAIFTEFSDGDYLFTFKGVDMKKSDVMELCNVITVVGQREVLASTKYKINQGKSRIGDVAASAIGRYAETHLGPMHAMCHFPDTLMKKYTPAILQDFQQEVETRMKHKHQFTRSAFKLALKEASETPYEKRQELFHNRKNGSKVHTNNVQGALDEALEENKKLNGEIGKLKTHDESSLEIKKLNSEIAKQKALKNRAFELYTTEKEAKNALTQELAVERERKLEDLKKELFPSDE